MLYLTLIITLLVSVPLAEGNKDLIEEVNREYALKVEIKETSVFIEVLYNIEGGAEKSQVTLSDQQIKKKFSTSLSTERLFHLFKNPLNYNV